MKNNIIINTLKFIFVVCCILLTISVSAQVKKGQVHGLVQDEANLPIYGATVAYKGTNIGTITSSDGTFVLPKNKVGLLEVSMLGYKSVLLQVQLKEKMVITLKEDVEGLDEVVIVAYGVTKKSDITGAVSSLKMNDDVTEGAVATVDQMLQGRIAGLKMARTSGDVGEGMDIQIRGISTLTGSTAPLFVVDGFALDRSGLGDATSNPLSYLNPEDIESINVLKDASATAIYGSRATNGVIVITTKQSVDGNLRINYSSRVEFGVPYNMYDMLNAYDFATYRNELNYTSAGYDPWGNVNYSGNGPVFSESQLEYFKNNTTDWQDAVYKNSFSQNHKLTISGGTKDIKYNVSGGWSDTNGILLNSGLNRVSLLGNFTAKLTPKLQLKANLSYSMVDREKKSHSDGSGSNTIVFRAMSAKPTFKKDDIFDESDDDSDGSDNSATGALGSDNPYKMLTEVFDINKQSYLKTSAMLKYDIIKSLSVSVSGVYGSDSGDRRTYHPDGSTTIGSTSKGIASRAVDVKRNINFEAMVNFKKRFAGVHNLDIVAGYTFESRINDYLSISANDFADNSLGYYSIGSALYTASKNSTYTNRRLGSGLARINYGYDNRYLFTLTGRYDGSSLLAPKNRWQFFPSAAFAWRVDQEDFMTNAYSVSNLKLRLSWGNTGNQNVGFASPYGILSPNRVIIDGMPSHGLSTDSVMPNPNIGWETTESYNIGLDLGFVDNKYRISVDAYQRTTRDMIVNYKLPDSSGYNSIYYNVGEMSNRGVEVEAGADILTGVFKLSVNGNIYLNRNNVTKLEGGSILGAQFLGNRLGQSIHITQEGQPIGMFYGYVTDGIYQTYEEAAVAPYDEMQPATPGSVKYVDISGPNGVPDGQITTDDMTIIGSAKSLFDYGLTINMAYKGFSLSALFTGRCGGQIANLNKYVLGAFANTNNNITQEAWDNRWTGPGTSNIYPAVNGKYASTFYNNRFSTLFIEDGTYLKLNKINLAYDFPVHRVKWLRNLRLILSMSDVCTWTNYSGYDPEVSITRSALSPGVDFAAYPPSRQYSISLNVGF